MKELDSHNADIIKPGTEEIRQVPHLKKWTGGFIIPPGCTLYEMVCVNPEDPGNVVGLNKETGELDTDLAIVRPAVYTSGATMFTEPIIVIGDVGSLPFKKIGKIKRNKKGLGKLIITDGNIYEVATNEANARRKIIAQYFTPNKDAVPNGTKEV